MSAAWWAAIAVIGAVTYLTRALPLIAPRRGPPRTPPAWLDALGPCIIAAIAVSVLLPDARAALAAGRIGPFAAGSLAAGAVMLWRRDPGLATIAGVGAYWLAL